MTSVSIIICTRNRADSLRETLASIAKCEVGNWTVDLLAVDNGSSDDTRQVIESATLPNMALRYLHEPRAGQCFARNAGLRAAHGEVIMFTDDDVRVGTTWIQEMAAPLVLGKADLVQGPVLCPQHLRRPWMKGMLATWVALVNSNDPSPPALVGANMGFRRQVFEEVGPFHEELGPGALGFFDDTLFSWQAEELGFKRVFVPEAKVEHHFDVSRMTPRGMKNIAERMAKSRAYVQHHWEHQGEYVVSEYAYSCLMSYALGCSSLLGWKIRGSLDERHLFHVYRAALNRELKTLKGKPRRYEKRGGTSRKQSVRGFDELAR